MKWASRETSISIVGPLFGFCVVFWAQNIVRFVDKDEGGIWPFQRTSQQQGEEGQAQASSSPAAETLEDSEDDYPNGASAASNPSAAGAPDLTATSAPAAAGGASDSPNGDGEPRESESPETRAIKLASGLLFLIDLLCILWWYAAYFYVVQAWSTLGTHFVDFSVCGMCAMASTVWDKPEMFFFVTVVASALLLGRFAMVYSGGNATDTDKKIIRRAGLGLFFAVLIAVFSFLVSMHLFQVTFWSDEFKLYFLPGIPGALAAIGIVLTFWLKDRITIAVNIHECRRRRFKPMRIHWPAKFLGDQGSEGTLKGQVTDQTAAGLQAFHDLFAASSGKLSDERLVSRVHAEGDLAVQGYILAVASQAAAHWEEIKRKAFVVGLSHWLDDLVDGRKERVVLRALTKRRLFGMLPRANNENRFTFHVTSPEFGPKNPQARLFKRLFRREITRYTGVGFYRKLRDSIWSPGQTPPPIAVSVAANVNYIYFGLNRVAAGAAMFSPRLSDAVRRELRAAHNGALLNLVPDDGGWNTDIKKLLGKMNRGFDSPGQILLALTTKTVQELAMSSEADPLDFPLSLLHSLLYAPLLYFHDVDGEMECGEIVPLDNFDRDYDQIIEWLYTIRGLCIRANDPRLEARFEQLNMAYLCFEPRLPESVKSVLEPIYRPLQPDERPGPRLRGAEPVTPAAPIPETPPSKSASSEAS